MWNDFNDISDLTTKRRITYLASLASSQLQPDFENPDVKIFPEQFNIATYKLGRICGKNGELLCGFYNDDLTDFLPLNTNGSAFAYLKFFLGDLEENAINKLQGLIDFQNAPPTLINNCERNADNYLPCKGWKYVEQNDEDSFFTSFESMFNETIEQLWICSLSFSSYRLAEYIFLIGDDRVKNYALFKTELQTNEISFLFILNGRSDVIFNVWDEKGFLIHSNETLINYLKFFCWEIEGESGKFILPEKIEELPWENIPDKQSWKGIHDVLADWKTNPIIYEEHDEAIPWDESLDRKKLMGLVVYDKQLVKAWFGVNEKGGPVRMPKDETLLFDLPLRKLRFGLQVPIWVDKLKKNPAFDRSLNKVADNISLARKNFHENLLVERGNYKAVSSSDFLSQLGVAGQLEQKKVADTVILTDHIFLPQGNVCAQEIEIKDCWFDDEVRLASFGSGPSLTFKNCVFAKKLIAKDSCQARSLCFKDCSFVDIYSEDQEKNANLSGFRKPGKQDVVIDFENYKSEGNLEFIDCDIIGEIFAPTMKLSGNLIFTACSIAHSPVRNEHKLLLERLATVSVDVVESKITTEMVKGYKLNDQVLLGDIGILYFAHFVSDPHILNISNSIIRGDLSIAMNLTIKDKADIGREILEKKCTTVIGNIMANGVEINGKTIFSGSLIIGSLYLDNSIFHQDVNFRSFSKYFCPTAQCRLAAGDLYMTNCNISGNILLEYTEIEGNVYLYSAHVETYIFLNELKTKENFDLRFATVKGGIFATRSDYDGFEQFSRDQLYIGRDLLFSASNIKVLRLEGIYVKGVVEVITGEFETFTITLGRSNESEDELILSRMKQIVLESVKIRGSLDLTGIKVEKDNLSYEQDKRRKEDNNGSCIIRASHIGADVKFFNIQRYIAYSNKLKHVSLAKLFKDYSTQINWGNMRLEANTVDGFIDLRNIQLNTSGTNRSMSGGNEEGNKNGKQLDEGNVLLNNCIVRLDVELSGFCTDYYVQDNSGENDDSVKENFNEGRNKPISEKVVRVPQANCKSLYMQKLHVGGDVRLTGLHAEGAVYAEDARVKGGMYLIADTNGIPCDTSSRLKGRFKTEIFGKFDLTGAEVGWVNLENENFPFRNSDQTKENDQVGNDNKARILLERGSFNKLTMLTPVSSIDLRNIKVSDWDLAEQPHIKKSMFGRLLKNRWAVMTLLFTLAFAIYAGYNLYKTGIWRDHTLSSGILLGTTVLISVFFFFMLKVKRTDEADNKYKHALNKMEPFDKGTYTSIEARLRNESKEEDADEIYRTMRIKSPKKKNIIWDFFTREFTGYGTELIKMGVLWYFLVCGFAVFISLPGNHATLGALNEKNYVPIYKAFEASLKYCTPIELPATEDCVIASNFKSIANDIRIASSVLLSLGILGITSRLIRGNAGSKE